MRASTPKQDIIEENIQRTEGQMITEPLRPVLAKGEILFKVERDVSAVIFEHVLADESHVANPQLPPYSNAAE